MQGRSPVTTKSFLAVAELRPFLVRGKKGNDRAMPQDQDKHEPRFIKAARKFARLCQYCMIAYVRTVHFYINSLTRL